MTSQDDPTTPLQGCIQSIAELTALYTQLHGIELYVRQYYLNEGSTGSGSGESGTPSEGGNTPTPTPDPTPDPNNGGGDNGGGGDDGGEGVF